jgi:membrane-bound lytic murein transglycosylase D
MWQFMPHGNYGLARTAYVDERFDPEKSTRAYARYMKFIYDQLGDWYLSMAGYDWGSGNVQRAVEKTGYADFWELYKRNNLPGETKNYVPEILAAIIIANHPTQYGFDDMTLDPPVLTDTISINYQVDLRLASDLVGASMDEMKALNPSLLRTVTPPDASFDLHLPAGTATLFNERIAAIPESKRNAWRYHRVTAEETISSVARLYRVTVADLAAANQMNESTSLAGHEALVVPALPSAAPAAHTLRYTVRRGDTLITIADRFGVSLEELRRWNKIGGFKVEPGSRLRVSDAGSVAPLPRRHHRASAVAEASASEKLSTAGKVGTKSAKPAARTGKSGAASLAARHVHHHYRHKKSSTSK